MASEQDSCLDWLLSSPVALFISEMDLRQDSTPPFKDGQPKNSTAPPTRLRWPSETQRQRRPSNSSDISAPDMVVDAGPPSPGTSCEGDDYDYHSSGDMIWDSWLEDNSLSEPQFYIDEEEHLPLRTQRSHLTFRKTNFKRPDLTKIRSVGDLHQPRDFITFENRDRTCSSGPISSSLHPAKYEQGDKKLPHGDIMPTRPYSDPVQAQSISRVPSSIRSCTLLEPRPQRTIPSINTSLSTTPHPSEWLSKTVQPPNPPSGGEKSVFEDWDEPKVSFWRRSRKRKRRSTNGSGSDGNGDNKSPRRKGGKLWNLSLLALPGML
ncbi:hypothetical protein OIDMADRAFT_174579 [Oidiodendron maius Zn]|uniref:Uncharacterized protein n=1 Tax=Oidiodendron maius (strain Zn) TaxID=913774 RepID=A0A0C3HHH8_OIDMZ|nr:hypothetical protein OIDMADRAFT_174579 [Oidiodendron maius Zn]